MRSRMFEAKLQEEKLRMQQKHDATVQKILDRKNSEIEDLKNHYRTKTREQEETLQKYERKCGWTVLAVFEIKLRILLKCCKMSAQDTMMPSYSFDCVLKYIGIFLLFYLQFLL